MKRATGLCPVVRLFVVKDPIFFAVFSQWWVDCTSEPCSIVVCNFRSCRAINGRIVAYRRDQSVDDFENSKNIDNNNKII